MSRSARRALALVATAVAIASWPTPASAHPLGNFTVNVYAGLIVQPEAVVVDYVVDMAEIPTVSERRAVDADLDDRIDEGESLAYRATTCASLANGLSVRADGHPVPVVATDLHALAFPAGAGGLSTLRLECRFTGAMAEVEEGSTIAVLDRNFPDALGWREMTVTGDGVTPTASDVPAASVSARLSRYPADELPLDVRRASATVRLGGPRLASLPEPGRGSASSQSVIDDRDDGSLASLVGREDLTPALVGVMVALALGVGALHALGPGHGKTLIGAYLVGAGGSVRHAVGVGAAVSVMHTASVLMLGLVVLSAERLFAPERVYPVLGLASGLIALGLGSVMLVSRIHARTHGDGGAHPHEHDHAHGHDHGHPHASPLSRRGLLALAFSGGILPSPTALVVLLASVSLGRLTLGLVLIAAFSLGLAGALIGVGIVTVHARDLAQRRLTDRAARLLPVASAGAIAAMGLFLTVRGAIQL
jgi:nickel/cobalt exporter